MAGIGVIYNPRSRHNRRDPNAGLRLERTLGDRGVVRKVHSIDALQHAAADFKRLGIDLLCISGGDGTSGVTIGEFLDVYGAGSLPPVALLRGGTANVLAASIGIPREPPERLLRRLVRMYGRDAARSLRFVERNVMQIRGRNSHRRDSLRASLPPGAATHGFLFGTGVVARYLEEYYALGEPSPLNLTKTLLRAVGSTFVRGPLIRRMATPFRGWVEFDDGTTWEERDYLAIAAGTIEDIGLGFKPFHYVADHPGTCHAIGLYAPPLRFVGQLANVWRGKPMPPGHAYEAATKGLRVHAASGPIDYMVDGDLYACDGPLELRVGPAIRIVYL